MSNTPDILKKIINRKLEEVKERKAFLDINALNVVFFNFQRVSEKVLEGHPVIAILFAHIDEIAYSQSWIVSCQCIQLGNMAQKESVQE